MPSLRCPYCKEPITSDAESCTACKRPLFDPDGTRTRDIEVPERWNRVAWHQSRRLRCLLTWGTPGAALLCLVSPFVTGPLHVVVSAPVLAIAHGIALHYAVVAPGQRLLSRWRRFLFRATRRLYFYPVALLGYMGSGAPLVGAIIGAGVFAGLTAAVMFHLRWVMKLDRDFETLTAPEKLLFAAVIILALSVLALIGVLVWGVISLWSHVR